MCTLIVCEIKIDCSDEKALKGKISEVELLNYLYIKKTPTSANQGGSCKYDYKLTILLQSFLMFCFLLLRK